MDASSDNLGARLAQIKGATLIKSFCYTCPWQCPTEVLVRDGKVVYHKGNPASPNNIGSRCASWASIQRFIHSSPTSPLCQPSARASLSFSSADRCGSGVCMLSERSTTTSTTPACSRELFHA